MSFISEASWLDFAAKTGGWLVVVAYIVYSKGVLKLFRYWGIVADAGDRALRGSQAYNKELERNLHESNDLTTKLKGELETLLREDMFKNQIQARLVEENATLRIAAGTRDDIVLDLRIKLDAALRDLESKRGSTQ